MCGPLSKASLCGCLIVWAICTAPLDAVAADNSVAAQTPARRIVVRLSREVFAPLVEKQVDTTTPVADFVLGARIAGRARTTGLPKLKVVDDPHSASFVITLRGANVSRTVGRNGLAIVHTRAETHFTATKRVRFQAGKGFVAEPAQIASRTRTITEGIGATRRGFVGRIIVRRASRQVAALRPQVEAIARQRAETRIRAAFDRYTDSRLAQLNRSTDMRPAIAWLLGGEGEPSFALSTKNNCVQIVASSASAEAFQAVELPAIGQNAAPVQVWVHESVIGDRIASLLKLVDESSRGTTLAGRALDAVPIAIKDSLGLSATTKDVTPALNYATARDWIVIQIGSQPGASVAASEQPAVASASGPPANAAAATAASPMSSNRIWTSADGRFTVVALLVSASTEGVTLKRAVDGKLVTVPMSKLSELDRKLVSN